MDQRTTELNRSLESSATALLGMAASEQRLEAVLSTAVDGILSLRADGTVELANVAAARLLNLTMDELLGSRLPDCLDCLDDGGGVQALQAALLNTRHGAVALPADYVPRRRGSAPVWLGIAVNPCTGLHAGSHVCVMSDVTARRELADRLIAKRQRMNAAVEHNQITTWELNLATGNFEISEALARSLGYRPEELQHCPHQRLRDDFIHPDDRAGARSLFEPLYRGEAPSVVATLRMRRRDGSFFWVRSSGTTVTRDAQGRPLIVFGTTVDISELVNARENAERTLRSKEAFVATMTHELRTPLNSILGFSQMLEADAGLNADQHENVAYVLRATRHLIDLVNQTLDLARLESGHLQARAEAVELGAACAGAVQLILPAAQARDIAVRVEDSGPVLALADQRLVNQVLLNLLSNAVKYNRTGGAIRVEVAAGEAGMAWVAVHDTGRGVRAEDLEALFEPFVRLDAEQHSTEGSGIGLAISRDLAHLMAGRLEVSSQPGVGSTFRLQLPVLPVNWQPLPAEAWTG